MDYRLVASPRATALRSILVCFSTCALLSCAKAAPVSTGSGGSNGSGGSHASGGSNGSGGSSSSGGNTGSGGSSSSGGNTGSGGSPSSGGNTGSGGSSSSGGNTGSGGSPSSGGNTGSGGSSSVSDAGADASCQTADFKFLPQIPDVYVLVDRSGSEFDPGTCSSTTNSYTGGTFFTLKTAVLQVIQSLQGQVRFGFGSFVGDHSAGTCAPTLTPAPSKLPIDLYNYNAINAIYGPLGSLSPCGAKADTPAVEVMPTIQAALLAEPTSAVNPMTNVAYGVGQKYLLFVTDSEVDFCDDGESGCPADGTTWKIQDLYNSGISTLIIGLPTTSGSDAIAASVLQNFANAGAGQPVATPGTYSQLSLHNNCQGVAGYVSTWNQAHPGQTLGTDLVPIATYSTTGGNAKVYAPTSTSDVTALTTQLTMALQGVKSCSFDLSDVNGKSIKVDTTMLGKASVKIQGNTIAQNATNGWSMSGATTLILNGSACDTWRMPSSTDINFAFPCSTIIFE